jgi:hypothetical protein
MIAKKPKQLVIDLSGVPYIDSAGLGAVIEAKQKVEAYGGEFALAGLQNTVHSIFEMLRLDQVFSIFPDVNAALAAARNKNLQNSHAIRLNFEEFQNQSRLYVIGALESEELEEFERARKELGQKAEGFITECYGLHEAFALSLLPAKATAAIKDRLMSMVREPKPGIHTQNAAAVPLMITATN